jgi:hypothetical protein
VAPPWQIQEPEVSHDPYFPSLLGSGEQYSPLGQAEHAPVALSQNLPAAQYRGLTNPEF